MAIHQSPIVGVCVEVRDYRLYNNVMDDEKASIWRVHPPDGDRAINALNLDSFRSASDVEAYRFDEVSSE